MLKAIIQEELNEFVKIAKKEGLIFCNKTIYFGFYINNEMVGFCGVIKSKNKTILKNDYIFKKCRGNRYAQKMTEERMQMFKTLIYEATCTKMSINYYVKLGFTKVKEYKNGCVKVRYENI